MKKLMSKKEREKYLSMNITKNGAYFIVKYDNITELLWFTKYEKWCKDRSDWYLEAPCSMRRVEVNNSEDKTYFSNIGYVVKEDNYAYEIDSPQVAPFLPEEVEIKYLSDNEEIAVSWMLENQYVNFRN